MAKDQLTFNDLPTVVGELCDRIASMENLLSENISRQSAPQENTHVPMTVQEACEYLRMPLSTFYYKVKKDNIPVIKQASTSTSIGTSWTSGWNRPAKPRPCKVSRRRTRPDRLVPPQTRTQKLVGDGNDRQPYANTGGIGLLHRGVGRAGSGRLRAVARRAAGGRFRDRDIGQLQRLDREGQETRRPSTLRPSPRRP